MMTKRRQLSALIATSVATSVFAAQVAAAQNWPTRPVTMVVPFAAGSASDTVGRILGARLSEVLGQQVIIENVSGAGGMTGVARVAKAPPDGYQIVLGGIDTFAQSQSLYKRPLYNAVSDFAPVGLLVEQPLVLVARKDLAPVKQDLIAGRIDYFCALAAAAMPLLASDSIRAIAIMTRDRSPLLPNLASAQEQGLTDLDSNFWSGFFVPKDTPAAVIERLHSAGVETLNTSAVAERLKTAGVTVVPADRRSSDYLRRFVESEIAKWAVIIKASGVSLD